MSHPRIDNNQITDLHGKRITSANSGTLIAGSATTTIFTGTGILLGIGIWVDVDGGTVHFTDGDDAAIAGLPNVTNKGITDYAGTFPVARLELENGLKVVTASATGLVMSVYTFEPTA
jgi:hypothetical protein